MKAEFLGVCRGSRGLIFFSGHLYAEIHGDAMKGLCSWETEMCDRGHSRVKRELAKTDNPEWLPGRKQKWLLSMRVTLWSHLDYNEIHHKCQSGALLNPRSGCVAVYS